jgi:hypothetical protein
MIRSPSARPAEAGRVRVKVPVTNSPVFRELVALAPASAKGGLLTVRVDPDPEVLDPDNPRIFQLFAVGLRAPPESPVIVLPAPVVLNVTNPVAATAKDDESKFDKPIFVESAAANAWLICACVVIVLPAPTVLIGFVPAATTAPRILRLFAAGIALPESAVNVVGTVAPASILRLLGPGENEIVAPELVIVAKAGAAPVDPMTTCPFVPGVVAVKGLVPCATTKPFAVNPESVPIAAKRGPLVTP